MKTEIFKDFEEFTGRKDKSINGVSQEFAHLNPDYKEDNDTNTGCWNCAYCRGCKYCNNCNFCRECDSCDKCFQCSHCAYCNYCQCLIRIAKTTNLEGKGYE